MSDPFNILGPEFDTPPRFEEVAREAAGKLQTLAERFELLYQQVPEERFTDPEWRIVESAAAELEEAVERAEEGYVAVQYDSHAWYRIMESLERVNLRLESAIALMETVRERAAG